ncbi:MAG: hypothetical protein NTW74_12000 [Acidobacteria bacterium]|nr:hypothetical protein [Acidobacteriota bacterium]
MTRSFVAFLFAAALLPAAQTVLVLTTDGQWVEGVTTAKMAGAHPIAKVLSMHNGAAASAKEAEAISAGLVTIQGKDRKLRDAAVEELTHIGLPVLTPLLEIIRDTDQHEPKPLYNLFDRIIPSIADQPDRSASLIRLEGATPMRGPWPQGELKVGTQSIAWEKIRLFAVQRKSIARVMDVHSLRHSTQIEYLDTGLYSSASSQLTLTAAGFSRLSWKDDQWATGPNGLTKPAGNYKSNLTDGHPFGALVGRVGAKGAVQFFGEKASKSGVGAGRLQLAINDNAHWQNNLGSYTVTVVLTNSYNLGNVR